MPTAIAFTSFQVTTWNIRNPVLRIVWNADFLAVAGLAALGLVLTLGFMMG